MGMLSNALSTRKPKTDGRPPTLVQVILPEINPTYEITDCTGEIVESGLTHMEALRRMDFLQRLNRRSYAIHAIPTTI